ncbi:MAG: hypothetical protein HY060_06255 [Proteobacteria bacterium]|nr:hypothetical protein [Pseudomonadota bacterium]
MRGKVIAAVAIAAGALTMLAGCMMPEIPYDRETAGGIKHVGIVTPHFHPEPDVHLASSVGQSFGLIGALADVGLKAERDKRFGRILQQANFSAQEIFTELLANDLRARGYEVSLIAMRRDKDFVKSYPVHTPPAVDAYLDLYALNYGYIAAGIGSPPYRPWVWMRVRLARAKDSAVLMQDTIVYNPVIGATYTKAVTIPPDPRFEYRTFDLLEADPAGSVRGLRTAIEQSAQAVGKLLK